MKKLLIIALLLLLSNVSYARDTYVNGYYRSNGTYVYSHYRTSPDTTVNNNYSTVGNVNPYTGVAGYKPRDNYYTTPYNRSYNNQYYRY